ncbi:hypothetical protein [Catenuloplanes japonicus]|uniref:hypothetical protein n=1 Tax=Catenuloplanes japonicus TaxID=33876 RepID=UPI000A562738|nr:hypothetical protein [Catenuloplanes japonicus]
MVGEWGYERSAVFSPYRTWVGVTVAVGLALATARLAGGRYVDEQIGMLTGGPDHEPDQVIHRTRLRREPGDGFPARCEAYLRQFSPEDRSVQQ